MKELNCATATSSGNTKQKKSESGRNGEEKPVDTHINLDRNSAKSPTVSAVRCDTSPFKPSSRLFWRNTHAGRPVHRFGNVSHPLEDSEGDNAV